MTSSLSEQSDRVDHALQRFRNEIENLARSYYLWKGFRNLLATDKSIVSGYQRAPLAWNTIFHSLQTNYFIVAGRIFDTNRSAFTIIRLRKICVKNIEAFSKSALQMRKGWDDLDDEFDDVIEKQIDEGLWIGAGRGWKKEYLDKMYEISKVDVEEIIESTTSARTLYESGVKTARDEIFSHSNFEAGKNPAKAFERVIVGDFERIINDLHTVEYILQASFVNGHPPLMFPRRYMYSPEVDKDIRIISDQLKRVE